MPKLRVRHAFVAVLLLVAMLAQGTWALAGTTGGLTGSVHTPEGAPVAGAKVTVSSPSQIASGTTDAGGNFSFLSLAPDAYTVSVTKEGYQDISQAGYSVFADQVQTVSLVMIKALKTIVNVRSQAASNLVKSGVGGDIYNVDPATMQKTAALGGGGNLDNAYSAIASVPGLVVGTGGAGWNQAVVVRGANPWTTGFEYDGIPVNRAFDNYTASTSSNLGLQELQVYTGGGPASISSTGISGFINQVIKTGTYPGYGMLQGGLSAVGAFYHSARVEAGGASPNRLFSYYVGIGGYDQAFRFIDQNNGANLLGTGSPYVTYGFASALTATSQGVFNECSPLGLADPAVPAQGCLGHLTNTWGMTNLLQDRENVVNFHFGVQRHNGQRDDIQLMGSASAMQTYNLTNPFNENNINGYMVAVTGFPYCGPQGQQTVANACALGGPNYPKYRDVWAYNLPFGTPIAAAGSATPSLTPSQYFQPNTPAHSFGAQLPTNLNDLSNNDTGIVKLQWTHPFSDRAFARVMGYTFFSDWTENGATSGYAYNFGWAYDSPNYDLITHTAGSMLQYFNQITDQHLLQFTANYTHASVNRFNHTGAGSTSSSAGSPIGLISLDASGTYHCYSRTTGNEVGCYSSRFQLPGGANAIAGGAALPVPPAGSPAAVAGAQWSTLWNGNASGTFNTVKPDFYSASLEDQWRPTSKLTLNLSVRFDQFNYGLAPAAVGQNPFYAQIVRNNACVNPANNQVLVNPILPGNYPPANPVFTTGPCAAATDAAGNPIPGAALTVHPNGTVQNGIQAPNFSLNVPGSYQLKYWSPRVSGTFTQNPDTVWRFSAGRFVEPPISASVEYLYRGGSAANLWTNFLNLGTYTPFHPITGETSAQYDLSLEKRIHGTAMSFKITPFYGTTSNWEQQSFIGAGFVTQVPVGKARQYGVESEFRYGDFRSDGLSGALTFTYTKSQVQFQPLLTQNQMFYEQQAINNYNALTKAGGGSPCYNGGVGEACPAAPTAADIANPYYNMPSFNAASIAPLDGWYEQGGTAQFPGVYTGSAGWYNSPYVTNLVLNYRHQKFAITPSLQLQAGNVYGSPYDVTGVDPRNCGSNQAGTGAVAAGTATALNCDYTTAGPGAAPFTGYLYVPNPQTGSFAKYGQFRQPNLAIANLQVSYDVSPKVTLQMTATNLWHTCFGGDKEPWTNTYPPSQNNCGYYSNSFYNGSGWYNGTLGANGIPSPAANNNVTAYPWEQQSYLPKFNNGIGAFIPFTLYLQAQVKL